jgi:hypothetical protein
MPAKPKLTAMAIPNTGHSARANASFGWGKTTSLLRALQLIGAGDCNANSDISGTIFFIDKHTSIEL